jgi:hypothetical protein
MQLSCAGSPFEKKFYPVAWWTGFIGYGSYAVYKAFDDNGVVDWITNTSQNMQTMKAETPWVEES